jgi:hypothetical protein
LFDGLAADAEAVRDLVVVTLPGVQRFIGEARSTADVRAASEIVEKLASTAAKKCRAAGGELVFPSLLSDASTGANLVGGLVPIRVQGPPGTAVISMSSATGPGALGRPGYLGGAVHDQVC